MEASLIKSMQRIVRHGNLTLRFPSGNVSTFGDGTGLAISARIADPRTVRKIVMDPALAMPEAYMDGTLTFETGTMFDFVTLLKKGNVRKGATVWAAFSHFRRVAGAYLRQRAGLTLARQNISHHYDLNEDLFRLFLDADMNYSCAYFEHDEQSLEDAQRAKQRLIASKLLCEPGGRALDIGSGWGGMGLYLARVCGLDVTGITLSIEQQRVATARAADAGLQDQVRFALQDYRSMTGQFDHITSIGMLEHVGRPQLKTYFRTVASLLDKKGTAVIHSMAQPKPQPFAQPFGDKYIFPGGYIPSLGEVVPAIESAGLLIKDIEVLPLHYARTCQIWRERFMANRAKAVDLYDERFARMWEMYLIGAEVGFRQDRIFVAHYQLARHQDRVPIRRNWIDQQSKRLNKAELGTDGS